eukprot:Sdes_comp21238_c0_seq1m19892
MPTSLKSFLAQSIPHWEGKDEDEFFDAMFSRISWSQENEADLSFSSKIHFWIDILKQYFDICPVEASQLMKTPSLSTTPSIPHLLYAQNTECAINQNASSFQRNHSIFVYSPKDVMNAFRRKGVVPLGIPSVLKMMEKENYLKKLADYQQESHRWKGLSFTFLHQIFSFPVRILQSVFHPSDEYHHSELKPVKRKDAEEEENPDLMGVKYLNMNLLERLSRAIVEIHSSRVIWENTDNLVSFEDFTSLVKASFGDCSKLLDSDYDLILRHLVTAKKIVTLKFPENPEEKMEDCYIKFLSAKNENSQKYCFTEIDLGIYVMKKTIQQVKNLIEKLKSKPHPTNSVKKLL